MLNWEINNILFKQRFQKHFTDFEIIILFPNVWFVYHFFIYICECSIANVLIWKTLTEVEKNSVAGLYAYFLERCRLSSFWNTAKSSMQSQKMFARMLFSTAQQFSTDQLDSFTDRLCLHILFSVMAHPIIARLRFLQHHLLKSSPSLFVIHYLKHRFVLLVTPFMPDSGFVSSYCSPVVFPAISCFGQTFLLLVHSSPCPHTCLPVLNCHLFSPLVPKLHSFCKTYRKFCSSIWADEKEKVAFQPNSISLPIYLWKTTFLISSSVSSSALSLPLSAAPSTVPIMHQVSATMRSITLSWPQPEQPNGIILDYEIRYYEKVSQPCLQACKIQGQPLLYGW